MAPDRARRWLSLADGRLLARPAGACGGLPLLQHRRHLAEPDQRQRQRAGRRRRRRPLLQLHRAGAARQQRRPADRRPRPRPRPRGGPPLGGLYRRGDRQPAAERQLRAERDRARRLPAPERRRRRRRRPAPPSTSTRAPPTASPPPSSRSSAADAPARAAAGLAAAGWRQAPRHPPACRPHPPAARRATGTARTVSTRARSGRISSASRSPSADFILAETLSGSRRGPINRWGEQ